MDKEDKTTEPKSPSILEASQSKMNQNMELYAFY